MAHDELLRLTSDYAAQFLGTLGDRPIRAAAGVEELREALGGPLPEQGSDPEQVVAELIAGAEPGVVAIPSGRYFGFVIGGALPAALAADWLTSTWDQNAGLVVGGPSAAVVEEGLARLAPGAARPARRRLRRLRHRLPDGACDGLSRVSA